MKDAMHITDDDDEVQLIESTKPKTIKPPQAIQLLPFEINYNGPAKINSYFLVDHKVSTNQKISHFRGRRLIGKDVLFPEKIIGLHGLVKKDIISGKGTIDPIETFPQITVWQHDIAPEIGNLEECFNWLELTSEVSNFLLFYIKYNYFKIKISYIL